MQRYKIYPKQRVMAVLRGDERIGKGKSVFQLWEEGAKELEKTAPGKLITAPIRLPAAVVTSTEKTVEQVPGVVKNVSRTLPFLIITAGILGGGFLFYQYKTKMGMFKNAPSA